MRIKDLQPETEYATCDGRMLVTGAEITSGWYQWTDSEMKRHVTQYDPRRGPATETGNDPWANCQRRSGDASGMKIEVKNGIKVIYLAHDRNGDAVPDDGTTRVKAEGVIAPKDIAGLWSDYKLLHADRIATPFIKHDLEQSAHAVTSAVYSLLGFNGFRDRPLNLENGGKYSISNRVLDHRLEVQTRQFVLVKPGSPREKRPQYWTSPWSMSPGDTIINTLTDTEITLRGELANMFLAMLNSLPPKFGKDVLDKMKVADLKVIASAYEPVFGEPTKAGKRITKAELVAWVLLCQAGI